MFFFAGFVLDTDRAELRGADGSVTRLRPKTLELLRLLVTNSHRVLGKEELMEAIWPGIHVGEDSLFQCIREIRAALGDNKRQMVQVVSGRGYRFALDVTTGQRAEPPPQAPVERRPRKPLLVAGLALLVLLAAGLAAFLLDGNRLFQPPRLVVELLPVESTDAGPEGADLVRGLTSELVNGFSGIGGIDLILPAGKTAPEQRGLATLQVQSELKRGSEAWILQARLIDVASREVRVVAETAADAADPDRQHLLSRLAAGIGYPLAARLSTLQEPEQREAGASDVAIGQAVAAINQTTRERFGTARAILEKYLANDPGNVDLRVALAGLHMRAVQMSWYAPAESIAAENDARALLEEALKTRPHSLPVLDAYCRFLTVSNQFAESLVACARALTVNPWDGAALYNLGLTQVQLGRFADALATFGKADRYDTPEVSRWTWLLGEGWVNLLLGRNEEAIAFLNRSIAITPGSGRSYLLLATAHHRLGQRTEAKAALAKAMELRPGATARNIALPTRNVSDTYLAASNAIIRSLVEVGLPTGLPR